MPEPPRQRGSIPPPVLSALDHKLEGEVEILEALLTALSRNQLQPEMWQRLFIAARRDERLAELAFAFESVLSDKKMKTLAAPAVGEFMFQAATFFGDVFGDEHGAVGHLEKALAAAPAHVGAFDKLESKLVAAKDHKRLSDFYADAAAHRPRTEQAQLLRQASAALAKTGEHVERVVELHQQVLRIEPADETTRFQLEATLGRLGRPRDVVRVLEQGLLVTEPPPSTEAARHMRSRLIELYADELGEIEKAVPHVEALLALDPASAKARQVAEQLLELKGVAARAAGALAEAHDAVGRPEDVARFLGIELEHTRGAKRRDVLRRLALLRQDKLGDPNGAFDAMEQALTLDPADDDLRVRYVALAASLARQLDAARLLGKIATTAKDPPVRARLSADMAELFLSGGDRKRARAVFASVLSMPDAAPDTILKAASALVEFYEAEGEIKPLADVLERVAQSETDPARLRAANEKLAELAMGALADPERAIVAWRRVLEASGAGDAADSGAARAIDPSRTRALAALEKLYGDTASPADLAFVLEERSKDAPVNEGRALLARAAMSLEDARDPAKALGAWRRYIERFGASRDVNARYIPLLEQAAAWADLASALEGEALLSPESEQGAILGRAGLVRLQRLREVPSAIDVFRRALAADAGERVSRTALEKLLAAGEHRVAAATALEPIYRAEESLAGLLRVLEVRATNATTPIERLGALDEAARVAESSAPHRASALDFAGRGLAEATSSGQPIESWIERVLSLSKEGDAKRRAAIFTKALGEKAVDSQSLLHLARHTGDALAAVGDVQTAIAVFRRALAYDPSSTDLIARVDALLRDQGSVHERVALYRSALERENDPLLRRKLFHSIGAIERHELGDLANAIEAYRGALGEDWGDRDAHAALVELYTETAAHADLIKLLEKSLTELTGSDALKVRAQLAEISARHGDAERALEHCLAILDDAAVSVEELDSVARVADAIHKPELECASLEKRAALAGDPRDAVAALDTLGTVRKEKEGNVAEAIEAWRRAARLAEDGSELDTARRLYERIRKLSPFDADCTERLAGLLAKQEKWSALPELYAVLVDAAPTPEARCEVLGKLANVLADKLGDLSGAADAAARAFGIDPRSPDTLASFERLAVLAGATVPFSRAIDKALEEVGPEDAILQQDLLVAKARVLAKDPTRHDDAAAIYKDLIDLAALETTRNAAVLGFEKLLDTAESSDARRADRRWLLSWRAEHAEREDKIVQLLAWARAEETLFSDAAEALGIHRRVLELDSENVEAAAAVARLTLASGDVSGAIAALVERRERSDGAAKRAIDLDIATILIERNEQLEDALASVTSLLDDAADDADAVVLASRFLRLPSAATPREDGPTLAHQAAAALERAWERAKTPAVRAAILSALLEAPPELSGSETRKAWFGDLALAQKEQGKAESALLTALRGAEEFPTALDFWDRAEELARELKTPGGVADLYYRVISTMQSPEDALEVGQRAVSFQEEWFDDPTRIVAILERLLAVDPAASWAFDRLKLLFDSREQWDDLFGLYDRAIAAAELERRIELLEDAAQTAKDFANHSERAIGYLQQLLPLKRETSSSTRIIASLERLYERHGRHRELIALLSSQLPTLAAREGRDARIRIASLSLDNLAEPAAALAVLEEVLAPDPKDHPRLSNLGDATSKTRLLVVEILERILAVAPRGQETRESMLPPPMNDHSSMTPPPPSVAAIERNGPASIPPPRARAKRTPVRQRTAALLKEHYVDTERDADLAKVLEVELEAIKSIKERIRRHRQVAELHVKLGNDTAALEHYIALVTLEPDVPGHREALAGLAERVNRFDRFAEVLTTAADDCTDDTLRVELLMQAATVHEDKLGDPTRAIELYLRLLSVPAATGEALLVASRRVDPLLLAAARPRERLTVLERMSDLETDPRARREALGAAAHLAADLGEHDRSITAWEIRLADDDADAEALDGLVALLEQDQRWQPLVTALTRRATAGLSDTQRRADRVRIARVHADELEQPDAAIDAWRAIDAEFGASEESTRALAGLLKSTERWEELATLLEGAATRETSVETRATLLRQLGDVRRERLADPAGAIKSYEAALGADPREPGALDGLHAMLENETHRASAIAALLWNYGITDEWRPVLDLTEHRLLAATDDAERVRVLQEAAQLAELRGNDTAAAYELVCRAFELSPSDLALEDQLFRLAEVNDGWRAFADVHRRAIEKVEEAQAGLPRRTAELLARLRIHLGEALERRLDDPRGALIAYLRAVNDSPADLEATRAAVRVAGPNMRWDAAAKVILHYALATGALDESLFGTLESVATTNAAWDGATGAFAAAISERTDIPPHIARDLEARVAAWHRDRRGDPDAAEAAFTRALVHDSLNAEILGSLAQLQRRAKGRPLVDSLLRLSQATGGDLELLREAAEIATSAVADRALAKSILEKLIKFATEMWVGRDTVNPLAITAGNGPPPDSYVRWAIGELIRIHNEEGDAEKIVDLLVETSALPFDIETRRSMRHQAARVAVDRIGDDVRAIALYAALFAEDGDDNEAATQLGVLYAALNRHADLLGLRRKQIELAKDLATRLELRLEAARLEVGLARSADAIVTLHASLKEEPRHAPTVAALAAVLVAGGSSAELASLLAEQAELAEAATEKEAAAGFWAHAAAVAEEKLGDESAAIGYHARVVALAANPASYDALARLSAARQDFAGAAEYLAQLRECAPAPERVAVTLRLVDALTLAAREDLAQLRLEEAVAQDPQAEELRARLAGIYRKHEDWAPLAALLAGGVDHVPGKGEQLARLREAADLYRFQCALPDSAVPLLQRAADLEPQDRAIRLTLADTLGAAGKLEEARALLRSLIDGFGGRRPKERAPVHYHLARLDLRAGDRAQALGELEAATRIDPANAEILRAVAELARDDGALERAERSYRALLAVVRRQDDPDETAAIVRSEVLLELSDIARRQGEAERSEEIRESALESAASHPVEAARLERALRAREDWSTLAKALELRLARHDASALDNPGRVASSAAILFDLADVLGNKLGRPEEAFSAALRAIELAPTSESSHEAMLVLARRAGGATVERYADTLGTLAKNAETAGDAALAGALYLRLASTVEAELKDDARAATLLEHAERLGRESGDVLRALDRLYARLGDRERQGKILQRLIDLEDKATPRNDARVADANLRLASLRLASGDIDEASLFVSAALDLDPAAEAAVALLQEAATLHPTHDLTLELYERVTRRPGRERALLDALARRAELPEPPTGALREAVALATDLAEKDIAEAVLRRYVAIVRTDAAERSHAVWAFTSLAAHAEAKGEQREAVLLRLEAADVADDDEARSLRFGAARVATESLADSALAATIYEKLLVDRPGDRAAWEPLAAIYRASAAPEARKQLANLLGGVVTEVDDDRERLGLRLERARLLLEADDEASEGERELQKILEEDPTHEEAGATLVTLLERRGAEPELVEVLKRQLDAAKDKEDSKRVSAIATRLGELVEKSDPAEAIEIYKSALDWDAANETILQALFRLMEVHGDAADRADVTERLLAVSSGPDAEKMALDLAAIREESWDSEGIERALFLGYRAFPASAPLHDKLLAIYTERSDWAKLAELHILDASAQGSGAERAALLGKAAKIFRIQLGDPERATAIMKEARLAAPSDPALFEELVTALTEAGNYQAAAAEITAAAAHLADTDPARATLLARRASLRAALGDHGGALYDLERAHSINPAAYVGALAEQLDQLRKEASEQGDAAKETALILRLVGLLQRSSQPDAARQHLTDLLGRDGDNKEAIRSLAALEEELERWDAASAAYRRLALLEDGRELGETALKLADVSEKAGELPQARAGLERALRAEPENTVVRERLRDLYARTGAHRELAQMSLSEARLATEDDLRFVHLVRGAAALLEHALDPTVALEALQEAHAIRPSDIETTALLADAYLLLGQTDLAAEMLNATLLAHKGRRSRDLALLHQRLSRIERANANPAAAMTWLSSALDMDGQNGIVASELAILALEQGHFDLATKALRAVTMLKAPAPMSKALAYQHLGEIAHHQGDVKKALLLLKRAVDDDPTLESAKMLLLSLQTQ